jgi:mono/diheme cytochrome c family protein
MSGAPISAARANRVHQPRPPAARIYDRMTAARRIPLLVAALLAISPMARGADALLPGDPARGERLHAAQCAGCHASMFGGDAAKIYTRSDHRVRSVEGLMGQVEGCARNLHLSLSRDEMNDLVSFLNQRYYKFTQQ